ncbi:MAG: hypothetical protein ACE5PM_06475 [Candidatus Hydrothermarchaeales archaeon]
MKKDGLEISADQAFILRLLKNSKMDAESLLLASLGSKSRVQRLLDELVEAGLVEKRLEDERLFYKLR